MTPQKVIRCAVYTRKSTEHNLDLEFNSLDAQRESCEAYIKSQLHEGWQLVPDRYDDGGISGGSLDRPDLQRLLADIRAKRVDNVVVYKVDRLTRSLTDFAKLVELFDAHGVSFVSVTQAFNTTNSMGRLTLNVLLSFAQFEREVIAERVRDKVAASKRKGMWMGGGVPLGYINRDKKLIIVPDEAETVRWIFRTYLEVGSIGRLLQKMDEQKIRSKCREPGDGRGGGGCRFGPGSLGYLLRNRGYVGEIAHRGQIHAGEHQPIIERELFDAVQAQLKSGAVDRKLKHARTLHLLKGKLFDSAGNRMTPSHSVKKGVRYRYYVSQAILGSRPGEAGRVGRVSAPELEALVEETLRKRFASAPGQSLGAPALVESHLERAVVQYDVIELSLTNSRGAPIEIVRLDWQRKPLTAEKGLTVELPPPHQDTKARDALLTAIGNTLVPIINEPFVRALSEAPTNAEVAHYRAAVLKFWPLVQEATGKVMNAVISGNDDNLSFLYWAMIDKLTVALALLNRKPFTTRSKVFSEARGFALLPKSFGTLFLPLPANDRKGLGERALTVFEETERLLDSQGLLPYADTLECFVKPLSFGDAIRRRLWSNALFHRTAHAADRLRKRLFEAH